MILIENPFPLFSDNNGELLESGYIYIGEAGLNPETSPINVFWDKDLLYPAAQPIRTINGLPSRDGTATPLYTASSDYSLLVKDKNQAFIYSTSFYTSEVVPADGSVTGSKIDDTAAFIFPTLLSLQKGADIAPAAGVLTLGIDGNYFTVTGTDPITSIASIGIGTAVKLEFDDALVLTYDATDIILPRNQSITTVAGNHVILVEYDVGKWKYVSGDVARDIQLNSDADGDIYYRDAGILTRLPKGSDDEILTLASGVPAWATPATPVDVNILSDPDLIGSGFSIPSTAAPAIVALNSTDVAFIDHGIDELRTYRFDGSTWSLVGNGFSIVMAGGLSALAALNETDVAFINSSIDELRTYTFDGTDWSLVGNGLSISSSAPALTALNGTDVAWFDDATDDLRTYRFDGSDWSLVGNGLSIVVAGGSSALTALNGTDVAFINATDDELKTYTFDGSDWSLVGSALSIAVGNPALAAMNSTDVALIDDTNDELRIYRFNGSIWSLTGIGLPIAIGSPALAAMNGTDVTLIDATNDELRKYRFKYVPGLPYNPSRSL